MTEAPVIKRAIGAAAIGNITEWYDSGVYAYFEPTVKAVFFADLPDPMGREKEQQRGESRRIAALWPFMLVCMGLVLA